MDELTPWHGFGINHVVGAMYLLAGQKNRRSRAGFTVIELLTVVAIMMVITAIATPSFYYWLPNYRLKAGARQVAADLQLARMKAISQNAKFRLSFVGAIPGSIQYLLDKEDELNPGTFIAEPGTSNLPEGITVRAVGLHPYFDPRGTANVGTTITLTNDSSKPITDDETHRLVCVKIVGRVHIEIPSEGC